MEFMTYTRETENRGAFLECAHEFRLNKPKLNLK